MPPRKRAVAERVTKTTRTKEVTERVIIEDATAPIPWGPGWAGITNPADPAWADQRHDQVLQCLDLLRIWALSNNEPKDTSAVFAAVNMAGDLEQDAAVTRPAPETLRQVAALLPAPETLRRETVTVLRAGPDASPMERTLGRSI